MIDRDSIELLIERLKAESNAALVNEAKGKLVPLRNEREFDLLDRLAEVLKKWSDDPTIILLQAQALIELRKSPDAIDLLDELATKVQDKPKVLLEAEGLLGRAYKQTFFDARNKTGERALCALAKSLQHYRRAYDVPPGRNAWPGLNMLAIAAFVARKQVAVETGIDVRAFAKELLDTLDATPPDDRDNWYDGSRAEVYLGLDNLNAVEEHIGKYVRNGETSAFALGGTLRQFTELWGLEEHSAQGNGIVQALRAALSQKEFGSVDLGSDEVRHGLSGAQPPREQLQKILGFDGLKTYEWLLKGLTIARSVGAICLLTGERLGTGFLIRGGDLIPSLGDEHILMTNAHVICSPPKNDAVAPEDAKVAFEAVDKARFYSFTKVIWQCAPLDCTLLRLHEQPDGIEPLTLNKYIPEIPRDDKKKKPRVYVIGYPGGRDLAFSLQDNALIDHEGPPDGHPPDPMVCRLHYRAPTEPGSSGSPVFDASLWRVIALHHAGDKAMPRLNGAAGAWPANEGIWIQSIVAAARTAQLCAANADAAGGGS